MSFGLITEHKSKLNLMLSDFRKEFFFDFIMLLLMLHAGGNEMVTLAQPKKRCSEYRNLFSSTRRIHKNQRNLFQQLCRYMQVSINLAILSYFDIFLSKLALHNFLKQNRTILILFFPRILQRYRDPCSLSLNEDDNHTITLVGNANKKAVTLAKTCEQVNELRDCRAPRDWSILALQNTRTGKSHYLVICKCPSNFRLGEKRFSKQVLGQVLEFISSFIVQRVRCRTISRPTPACQASMSTECSVCR